MKALFLKSHIVGIMILGIMVAYFGFMPQALNANSLIGGHICHDCTGTINTQCGDVQDGCCGNPIVFCDSALDNTGVCAPTGVHFCWTGPECGGVPTTSECN